MSLIIEVCFGVCIPLHKPSVIIFVFAENDLIKFTLRRKKTGVKEKKITKLRPSDKANPVLFLQPGSAWERTVFEALPSMHKNMNEILHIRTWISLFDRAARPQKRNTRSEISQEWVPWPLAGYAYRPFFLSPEDAPKQVNRSCDKPCILRYRAWPTSGHGTRQAEDKRLNSSRINKTNQYPSMGTISSGLIGVASTNRSIGYIQPQGIMP